MPVCSAWKKSAAWVCLAIDDFMHRLLARLPQAPAAGQPQLDRSFVKDLETNNDAAICTATISLAHHLGLAVGGPKA
jgi:EAL domain-containing protein (putative c-di-GMP-specific phosphodiesterase class I)